jgi:hypothetical protein
MSTPRENWPKWIDALRKQGLADPAAWVLEAAGPLKILGAQALYVGRPFFSSSTGQGFFELANILENEEEAGAFVALLKGKVP